MNSNGQATWIEFVEWVKERCEGDRMCVASLNRIAQVAKTRRDAAVAFAAAFHGGYTWFDELADKWLSILSAQGISPPADQPSAVEELERIASVMESSLGHRKSTNLSEWQQGFEASERSTIEGLRVRALQLKETA